MPRSREQGLDAAAAVSGQIKRARTQYVAPASVRPVAQSQAGPSRFSRGVRRSVRRIARGGLRLVRPVARPILGRLRTFFSQPVFASSERVRRELSNENAVLRARVQRLDSMLTQLLEEQTAFIAEYRENQAAVSSHPDPARKSSSASNEKEQ